MSSTNNSNFTRGAQLWAHNIRMGLQGVKNICLFGLVFVFLLLAYRVGLLQDNAKPPKISNSPYRKYFFEKNGAKFY